VRRIEGIVIFWVGHPRMSLHILQDLLDVLEICSVGFKRLREKLGESNFPRSHLPQGTSWAVPVTQAFLIKFKSRTASARENTISMQFNSGRRNSIQVGSSVQFSLAAHARTKIIPRTLHMVQPSSFLNLARQMRLYVLL
jgi:hypothetical protein